MATFTIRNSAGDKPQAINVTKSTKEVQYNLSTGLKILPKHWDSAKKRVIGLKEAKELNERLRRISQYVDEAALQGLGNEEVSAQVKLLAEGGELAPITYTVEKTIQDYTTTDLGLRMLKMMAEWVDIERVAVAFGVRASEIGNTPADVVIYLTKKIADIKSNPKEAKLAAEAGNTGMLWLNRLVMGADHLSNVDTSSIQETIAEDMQAFMGKAQGPKKPTVISYFDYYLKHKHPNGKEPKGYRNAWGHFINYMTQKGLERVTTEEINGQVLQGFIAYLESRNYKTTYVGRTLKYIKAILNYYNEYEGTSMGKGFSKIKIKKTDGVNDIVILQAELDKLKTLRLTNGGQPDTVMAGANLHRWLFLCQCSIGLRQSDFSRLTIENLREEDKSIRIQQKKTKSVVVAECIDLELWEKLKEIVKNGWNTLSAQRYNNGIKSIVGASDCKYLSLNGKMYGNEWTVMLGSHNARRSYICNHYLKYKDIERTRKNAGHATIEETIKYKWALDT